jgi:hypothetical protein
VKPTAPALVETAFDRIGCELVAEALRAAGGPVVVRVGGSMVPAIWPGDSIEIVPAGEAPMGARQVAFSAAMAACSPIEWSLSRASRERRKSSRAATRSRPAILPFCARKFWDTSAP